MSIMTKYSSVFFTLFAVYLQMSHKFFIFVAEINFILNLYESIVFP